MAEQILRNEMYREIHSHNKYLTEEYLNGLSTQAVIRNTHPLYRGKWQFKFDTLLVS